jgi:nucleoside-diphosphate-sugar epimerase
LKFLIIGGGGNLGKGCIEALGNLGIQATSWDINEDIFNLSPIFISNNEFDLVVNFSVNVDSKSVSIKPSNDDFKVNVMGLFHLINVCEIANIPLIQISTREVIGAQDFRLNKNDSNSHLIQVSEKEPCLPKNSYGKTKLIAEWLLSDKSNSAVIRLNTCYTDDWRSGRGLVSSLVSKSRVDGVVTLDNRGRALRDPLHVSDLATLISLVFEKSFFGGIIHAGGGLENVVSLHEICTLANSKVKINFGGVDEDYGFLMDISLARSIGWNPKVLFRKWINEN